MRSLLLILAACTCQDPSEDGVPPVADGPPADQRCENTKADSCWVFVPGGRFAMGAQASDPSAPNHDPDARPEEGPVHEVEVSSFWMMQQEVDATQWQNCMDGPCGALEGRPEGEPRKGMGSLVNKVTGITWREAETMCAFLGGRLPTEAEWEYAARGSEGRRYPWGDTAPCGLGNPTDKFAVHPPDARHLIPGCEDVAEPISARSRNPLGMVDLAWGNAEWVADWYAPDAYAQHAAADPRGPADGTLKVQRGGAWSASDATEVRSAGRAALPPAARMIDAGVRCAW